MNDFLNNLLQKGQLPTVDVNVTIDNQSLIKIAGAFLAVMVIGILLHTAIRKHS